MYGVPRATLIAMLDDTGYENASAALKRYVREGVMPHGRQSHEAGINGSRSLYPDCSVEHLQVVIELERQFHSVDQVRLHLWLANDWVEPSKIRPTLARLAAKSQAARTAKVDPN